MDFLVQQNLEPNEDAIAENSPCGQYMRHNTLLGKGTFKEVYKGFDHIHNIEIAWNKICIQETTTHEKPTLDSMNELERLCYEAVLLKSMKHKNIMNCYTYWVDEENRTVNIITEFLCSGSLRQHLEKHGKVKNVETIKNWGRQILLGLHYLHTQYPCIIHRDLKCDNIFVNIEKGEIIEKCLLPALSRPSASELLNDPFFSDSLDIELDSSCSSSTTSYVDSPV
ncbi:hypothetical protein ACJIZ3_012018 [Penstemon smallii]|uniref:non-specific serine/threonine protein kinase n=1 Tax=Penstemon smallii TaxID=265156 RepID=A0ABD3UMD2_9LAMI